MINQKKGQIQISFGMIFSIIIVIATIAVAVYVIIYFLGMSNCTKNGTFWDSLQKEIDLAWNSDGLQKVYSAETPSGITKLCFGNSTQIPVGSELERYRGSSSDRNAYFYPTEKACEGFAFKSLKHITTDSFFCIPVKSGKISLKILKLNDNVLVKLSAP